MATSDWGAYVMLTYRLVRAIETRSSTLASSLLHKVQTSERTADYSRVPPEELRQRVAEVYCHLGEWLLDKSAADVEDRYIRIGARRAQQGVPLSEVIWAIVLTKDNLWEYVMSESYPAQAVDGVGKLELLQFLDQFFDRAIHASALGYEWAATAEGGRDFKW